MIGAIVARNEDRLIGLNNDIPWFYKGDLKLFKKLTTGCVVIMGRSTWESLPEKMRPLPRRENYVVTSQPAAVKLLAGNKSQQVWTASSITQALEMAQVMHSDQDIWFMGGERIYREGFPLCDVIVETTVPDKVDTSNAQSFAKCPEVPKEFSHISGTWHPFDKTKTLTVRVYSKSPNEFFSRVLALGVNV